MLWPVVKALLGHYRRYPLQVVLVWLGLTLGVSLLSGVTAINQYARQSYQTGEKLFASPLPYRIRPQHLSARIPQGFYVHLRRAGFEQCVPLDSYTLMTNKGVELNLVGIDPAAMVPLNSGLNLDSLPTLQLMYPPHPVMVSEDLAHLQHWRDGDSIPLEDGSQLGPILIDKHDLLKGIRIVADMTVVHQYRNSNGFSMIACGDMSTATLDRLQHQLPQGMVLVRTAKTELSSLTHAFHLNLTAMGMLSFLVGLFIFYQAMSLSLTQRQPLVGMLRQAGVSGGQLAKALTIELVLLVFVSWLCGNLFGLMLANKLIPAVSASLHDLYDANVGLSIHWQWSWSLYTLFMAFLGAFASCAWPLVRLLKSQPIRLTTRLSLLRFAGAEFAVQAVIAIALGITAFAVYQSPKTQSVGFILIGLVLLSVALITPFIVWKVFDFLSYRVGWVKVRRFFADAAASMSYRGVATMAFMIAMAANIGAETMTGSFRSTTDQWLNDRLAADLYLYPTNANASRISNWLEQQPEVSSVWWRWQKDVMSAKGTIQVVSTGHSQGEQDSMTVKLAIPHYWYFTHSTKAVMISESMAIKQQIRPGDFIDLPTPLGKNWLVTGVYYDYGNPYSQVMMSQYNWLSVFAGAGNVSLAVVLQPGHHDTDVLKKRLNSEFRFGIDRIHSNTVIHKQAMRVFDRTFTITDTLGNITLLIAVCGIFFATLAGEISRQRHVSLLRCLGVSGKELVWVGALQLFVFWAIALLIALPLGILLAHLMVDVLLRDSFGWTMQVQLVPDKYVQTALLSMLALLVAGALPVLRLVRKSPLKSLRDAL